MKWFLQIVLQTNFLDRLTMSVRLESSREEDQIYVRKFIRYFRDTNRKIDVGNTSKITSVKLILQGKEFFRREKNRKRKREKLK